MGNIPVTTTTKIFPKVLQYRWEGIQLKAMHVSAHPPGAAIQKRCCNVIVLGQTAVPLLSRILETLDKHMLVEGFFKTRDAKRTQLGTKQGKNLTQQALSGNPKPHPSKPHPCNMPQAKTEVALQLSECCAAEVALQHSLFCGAEVVFAKSCAAASEKLQCNIEKAALQKSGAFLPLSCGFQAPTFRHPRLGPADIGIQSGLRMQSKPPGMCSTFPSHFWGWKGAFSLCNVAGLCGAPAATPECARRCGKGEEVDLHPMTCISFGHGQQRQGRLHDSRCLVWVFGSSHSI